MMAKKQEFVPFVTLLTCPLRYLVNLCPRVLVNLFPRQLIKLLLIWNRKDFTR